MELATVGEAVAFGPRATDFDHPFRWVQREEAPARETLRKMRDLRPGARTDAEQARLLGQVGEHRFQQEQQAFADRRHPRPLRVIARGLLVEEGVQFVLVHGRCFPMIHSTIQSASSALAALIASVYFCAP